MKKKTKVLLASLATTALIGCIVKTVVTKKN